MKYIYRTSIVTLLLLSATIAHAGITVSQPTSNTTVSSPVRVVASATPSSSSYRISAMMIYVNSTKVFSTSNSSFDTSVSLKSGVTNKMQVKAWDSSGAYWEKVLYLTVGQSSTSSGSTSDGTTIYNLDHKEPYFDCDNCAGAGADGSSAYYWDKLVYSPTMDGKSRQFHLGGSTPYSNALWSHRAVTDGTKVRNARHFVFDTYFYYKNSHAAQGYEFNISQYFDGKAFIYGMQCDIRSSGVWEMSVPKDYSKPLTLTNMKWQSTGISCPAPPTYKWNRVTIEYERTSENKVKFISISFNGVKKYINIAVSRRISPSDWLGINTHFQMNGNYQQEDYDTWLDKWNLKYWN